MKKIIIVVLCFILLMYLFVQYRTKNTISLNTEPYTFEVEKGDDIIEIGKSLAEKELIANRFYFYYYAWQQKLRGTIRAGQYDLPPHSTIVDIVYKMTQGDVLIEKESDIKVTFPEGWGITRMGERLNEKGLPGDDFDAIAQRPSAELRASYDFLPQEGSLEGYLFPDTYFFTVNTTSDTIVRKMLDNFDEKVDQKRRESILAQGKTLHEMIIFASIIEGEVPTDADRGIVAGIFKNRLDIGMALQSDATIDYIKGFPELKHTKADTEIDSPYNTYLYPGLPPGPINNPSLASIDAAIDPDETDFMYFLNNIETGETIFSRTFEEHKINKNINGL